MYFWERRNEIRDSDEKSAGCGILVKKERECGIRTPPSRPCGKLRWNTRESVQEEDTVDALVERGQWESVRDQVLKNVDL